MVIYGRNSVEEALEEKLTITEAAVEIGKEEKFGRLAALLRQAGVPVKYLPGPALEKYSDSRKHQGIAAVIALPPTVEEDASEDRDWSQYSRILALDGITDTGNLGAIIRSAVQFGFDTLVLPKDASARITPQTIRTSAGALYKQKILYVNNLNTVTEMLLADGFDIYGLAADGTETIENLEIPEKACLVIGSEREGMRRSVRKRCTALVKIPTTRKTDSLNASVAAAIAMWEVFRKGLK